MNPWAIGVMLFGIIVIWGGFAFTLSIELRNSKKQKAQQHDPSDDSSDEE